MQSWRGSSKKWPYQWLADKSMARRQCSGRRRGWLALHQKIVKENAG